MATYHLNNESYDVNLGLDLNKAQIGHTVIVNTEVRYRVTGGEERIFPLGKYKIVDFVHIIKYAAWIDTKRVTEFNVYLEEIDGFAQ